MPAPVAFERRKCSSNARDKRRVGAALSSPLPRPTVAKHWANREVQSVDIDIWSAGVILLTILARRFPFFNSADDVEALIELATIFGRRKMRAAALLHGAVFETTIPTVGERGFGFDKLVLWSTGKWKKGPDGTDEKLWPGDEEAIRLLQRCLELDPNRRISAEEALDHDFLNPSPETELAEEAERNAWLSCSPSAETPPAPPPPAQGPDHARMARELMS